MLTHQTFTIFGLQYADLILMRTDQICTKHLHKGSILHAESILHESKKKTDQGLEITVIVKSENITNKLIKKIK